MCDNPFIVHEFFCAQKRGTRRRVKREQTKIIVVAARKSQHDHAWGFSGAA
jgi:hypothetical protein